MVDGLAEHFELTVLGRNIEGGVIVSQSLSGTAKVIRGPGSRVAFAACVLRYLLSHGSSMDFVLVQGYGLAALAANLVCRLKCLPSAMLVCSPVELYYRCRQKNPQPGKEFRTYELFTLVILARLNAILGNLYVTLSEHLSALVRSHGARQVVLLPLYGVDTGVFAPSIHRSVFRSRLGLPAEGSIIFFSSRTAPEKDSHSVLLSLAALRRRGYDVWLLHRSGGFESLLDMAGSLNVADRVLASDAVDPREDLADLYRASDVCVQASHAEGLGFSVLEAMACGVPVVASAVGGLLETVMEPETGWRFAPGDALALADKIEDVIKHPREASERALRGREMVIQRYDQAMVFRRFSELVERETSAVRTKP